MKWKETVRIFEIIKELFHSGFYFSYTYNLTIAKEKQAQKITSPDERFWWNQYLLKDLISQKVDAKWMIYLMQVYKCLLLYKYKL